MKQLEKLILLWKLDSIGTSGLSAILVYHIIPTSVAFKITLNVERKREENMEKRWRDKIAGNFMDFINYKYILYYLYISAKWQIEI